MLDAFVVEHQAILIQATRLKTGVDAIFRFLRQETAADEHPEVVSIVHLQPGTMIVGVSARESGLAPSSDPVLTEVKFSVARIKHVNIVPRWTLRP